MSNPFSRTLRALGGDRSWAAVWWLAVVIALISAWAAWAVAARVPVYVTSESARLEAREEAYPVASLLDGRLVVIHAHLGATVEAEEVLFELDATVERQRLQEERARRTALEAQLRSLRQQRSSAEAALEQAIGATTVSLAEARARQRAANSAAKLAAEDAERSRRLEAEGLLPASELHRADAIAEQRRADAEVSTLAEERAQAEAMRDESDRRALLALLDRDLARLAGDLDAATGAITRLQQEVERRLLRAPAAGLIGEIAKVAPGAFVAEGDLLATVIPASALRLVASFNPETALGRIRPGQHADITLAGFPWMEYGKLDARVAEVAAEVRDSKLQATFALEPKPSSVIPLQHGLPGSVVVEVERVSPASLILRATGSLLRHAEGASVTDSRER